MQQEQITIVVALIKNEKGEILVAQRHGPSTPETHNKWEFVGGGIEFGETPEEAIIREAKEEAGINVKVTRLLPKIFSPTWEINEKMIQIIILSFECEIVSGQITEGLDPEIKNLKFISQNEIKKLDCLPNVKEIANLLN